MFAETTRYRLYGSIPGAIRIPRNVLEWRADPSSAACDPRISNLDAVIVIVCQQGYQSSLAVEQSARPRFHTRDRSRRRLRSVARRRTSN